jgi:hypothetical protein
MPTTGGKRSAHWSYRVGQFQLASGATDGRIPALVDSDPGTVIR